MKRNDKEVVYKATYWLRCDQHSIPIPNSERREWIDDWDIVGFYPYAFRVNVDKSSEITMYNFSLDVNDPGSEKMSEAIYRHWFEWKLYRLQAYGTFPDNKTVIKLQNTINPEIIVYMGWFDNCITVSQKEPIYIYGSGKYINLKKA